MAQTKNVALGIGLIITGGVVIVGSAAGTLPAMMAALFDAGILTNAPSKGAGNTEALAAAVGLGASGLAAAANAASAISAGGGGGEIPSSESGASGAGDAGASAGADAGAGDIIGGASSVSGLPSGILVD